MSRWVSAGHDGEGSDDGEMEAGPSARGRAGRQLRTARAASEEREDPAQDSVIGEKAVGKGEGHMVHCSLTCRRSIPILLVYA